MWGELAVADDNLLGRLSIDRNEAAASGSKKYFFLLLAVVLAGGAGFAYKLTASDSSEARQAAANTSAPPSVTATPNQTSPVNPNSPQALQSNAEAPILDASGYVVAMRIATASSKTVARVEEVLVEEGMVVKAGQIIARLDSVSQRIQLDLNRARLTRAKAASLESESRLREAQLAFDRTSRMREADLISAEQMDNASIRVDTMNAELQRQAADILIAEQEILLQEQIIEDSIIRAPFDGVVVQKNAQPGEIVSPSSSGGFTRTGICTIVDMSSLEIEVDVSESYINRISVGQRAEAVLDAYPDWTIPAAVSAIVPTADRQRATIKVRVRFLEPGDSRILPDMGIKVSFYDNKSEG
jgi:RND family efflux transporter MFP subunit